MVSHNFCRTCKLRASRIIKANRMKSNLKISAGISAGFDNRYSFTSAQYQQKVHGVRNKNMSSPSRQKLSTFSQKNLIFAAQIKHHHTCQKFIRHGFQSKIGASIQRKSEFPIATVRMDQLLMIVRDLSGACFKMRVSLLNVPARARSGKTQKRSKAKININSERSSFLTDSDTSALWSMQMVFITLHPARV